MFSMIINIYNKKTKGNTLMEYFTATRKQERFFFLQLELFDVCRVTRGALITSLVVKKKLFQFSCACEKFH